MILFYTFFLLLETWKFPFTKLPARDRNEVQLYIYIKRKLIFILQINSCNESKSAEYSGWYWLARDMSVYIT